MVIKFFFINNIANFMPELYITGGQPFKEKTRCPFVDTLFICGHCFLGKNRFLSSFHREAK